MRTRLSKSIFLGAAICFINASGLSGQTAREPKASSVESSQLELAITFSATRSDVVGGSIFWMQGGGIQTHALLCRGLGIVADLSGLHQANIQSSGVGVDMVTATFGPRYTWQLAHTRYSFYGQTLAGIANAFNSEFPASSGVSSDSRGLALKFGGGLNVHLSPRIGLRAVEADWLRTQFPNSTTGTQGSLQLSAGFVFRF